MASRICQTCPGGALGIVIVRLGPAEECHSAVAKIFRDVTAETGDRFRCRSLVVADGLAPLLRVELR
jgi:hypothetical protein